MSEPNDVPEPPGPAEPSAELVLQRQTVQLKIWEARQLLQVERERAALEVERNTGLMERRLQARALAASELVPAGYRIPKNLPRGGSRYEEELDKAAANILLAQEMGASLGLSGIEALTQLQVVEGNIGWAPVAARGRIMAAGNWVRDTLEENEHGVPISWRIDTERNGEAYEIVFTLDHAVRMGLCTLEYADGAPQTLANVTAVKARSSNGKPLPWETATEDMLCWRASSRLKRIFADVLAGVPLSVEYERPQEQPPPAPEVIARLRSQDEAGFTESSPRPDGYNPAPDLAVAGERWWEHAGASVKRRNRRQMAADRLMAAAKADPLNFPGPLPPEVTEVASAMPETDGPATPEEQEQIEAAFPVVVPHDQVRPASMTDEEAPLPPLPEKWSAPLAGPVQTEVAPKSEEDRKADLLVLLDDYAQQVGRSVDQLTLRMRAQYARDDLTIPTLDELDEQKLTEVAETLGKLVEQWQRP